MPHDPVKLADTQAWLNWKFRYPGNAEEPTQTEAEEAVGLARECVATVLLRLPQEAPG